MSRPFINISSANKAFGQFKESNDASSYIYNKKARATYCVANKCQPSIKVDSQSDKLLFNKSNQLSLYPCANGINTANLNINLVTRLNLRNVPVIQDASSGAIPSTIKTSSIPYLDYVIDPSGALFGNSVCGINNFIHFITPNINVPSYIVNGVYEITGDSSYNTIITFYGNSVIEFLKPVEVNYLIVGGGGGSGSENGKPYGGGGGGQVKMGNFNSQLENYNITIGAGGLGNTNGSGQNGTKSSIVSTSLTIDASGGFGSTTTQNGGNSGAGSGTGGTYYGGATNPPPSTVNGTNGGGGAGGSGQRVLAGNGGLNNINPNYGGGGGGGSGNGFISGGFGVGGGGNGGNIGSNAFNGTPNTGGGGGGSSAVLSSVPKAANGGSGVVIFSFNV